MGMLRFQSQHVTALLICVIALGTFPSSGVGQALDLSLSRSWIWFDRGSDHSFGGWRVEAAWWPLPGLRIGPTLEYWPELVVFPETEVSAWAAHLTVQGIGSPAPWFDIYASLGLGYMETTRAQSGERAVDGRSSRAALGLAVGPPRYRIFGEFAVRDDDGANDADLTLGARLATAERPRSGQGDREPDQFAAGIAGMVQVDGLYRSVAPAYSLTWRHDPSDRFAPYGSIVLLHLEEVKFNTRAFLVDGGFEFRPLKGGRSLTGPAAGIGLFYLPEGPGLGINPAFTLGGFMQTYGPGPDIGLRGTLFVTDLGEWGTETAILLGGYLALGG